MKKIFAICLVALMVASVFAQGGAEATTEATSTGPMKITMWYSATQTEVGALPDDWAGYQILKDKLGIDLELTMLPSATDDQKVFIQAAAAADNLPDFFACDRTVWITLAQNGMCYDVTDLYALMPNRTSIMFDEAAIKYASVDGTPYGFATPSAIAGNEGLLIRQDWLDKLGLAVPTTLDELYNVLYAFTYNDPDGNGKNDTYGYGAFVEENQAYEIYPGRRFEPLMGAFGVEGNWDMKADSFGLMIHKDAYYDWMVFFKKCIDNGVIDPNWQSYKKDDFRAAWKQGKFGCFREQNSAYASQNNYKPFDDNFPEGSFTIIDAPIGPDGKQSIGPLVAGKRIYAINSKVSKAKAEKIAEMFEWMSYGEGYYLCGFGVEGVNYEMIDGVPNGDKFGDYSYNKSIGQTYIQLRNCAFNYKDAAELLSRYPVYTTAKSGKQMSAFWALEEMQAKTWTATPGQDSMPTPSTDLATYYKQSIAEFLNGSKALTKDNWNAFIAQLDKLGAKDWEKEGYEYAKANNYLQ